MPVQPYLFFDGRCEEAIDFYKKELGAKVEMMMRFKEAPEQSSDPNSCGPGGNGDKIMHAAFKIGESTIMASDGHCTGTPEFKGFSLSLPAKTEAEADKLFGVLSNGGQVQLPLTKTFFSPRFGMVADKFGIGWMVIVEP
jgi:PhnB protein